LTAVASLVMSVSYLKQQSLHFNTRSKKGAAGNAPSRRIC
jgi:hypothetical protein